MAMSIEIEDLIARGVLFAKMGFRKMRVIQAEFLAGDLRDEIEHFEPYGFTSEAKPGAEVLATSIMGDRDHTIAFCITDRRYRPVSLKDGEVCIFDDLGRQIFLRRDGITIEGKDSPVTVHTSGAVKIDAPEATITGRLVVNGDIVGKGQIYDSVGRLQSIRDTYNGHTHNGGSSPDQKM